MLGLLFLTACVWFGFSLLRLCGIRLSAEERWVAGPALGLVFGVWLVLALSTVAGSISSMTIAAAGFVVAAAWVLARWMPAAGSLIPAGWFILLALCLGIPLVWMNLFGVLAHVPDGVAAVEHIWADTPFHASISTSFAYRSNIPPMYPIALGEPLGYPFLVDLASGIVQRLGLSLRWSFISVNVVIHLTIYLGIAVLAHRLTRRRSAGVLAAILFFCLGNLGVLTIPADIAEAGGVMAWLREIPWSYTGDALGNRGRDRLGIGVYLGNPTFMFVVPRRAGAFGLAAGVGALLLLEDLMARRRWQTAVLFGALLGLLPRVHVHSAIAIALAAAVGGVSMGFRQGEPLRRWPSVWGREWKPWAIAATVAIVVAVPQAGAVAGQASGFVQWSPGWIGEAREALSRVVSSQAPGALATFAWFWMVNAGLLLILAFAAFRSADRRMRLFYMPFALLWVLGNLVRTQPLEWDNTPWFVWWQAGTCILVAGFLSAMWTRTALHRTAAVVCLVAMTLGGVLSFVYGVQHRQFLWSDGDMAGADAVQASTHPEAVVLTAGADFHGHPVNALSGRQVHMGWAGWLLAHGLDWDAYQTELEAMYRGDIDLMREVGIDYVVAGPFERGYADQRGFELDTALDSTNLETVWVRDFGGQRWTLYRVPSSSVRSVGAPL